MELQELYELMERFGRSGLTELEWSRGEETIALRKTPAPAALAAPVPPAAVVSAPAAAPAAPAAAAPAQEGDFVKAPLVGTFYAAPAPGEAPFAAPGRQVKKGETLCLIEAMKMMSEIPAPADCVVEEILVDDGSAVGYGQPLFRVRRV